MQAFIHLIVLLAHLDFGPSATEPSEYHILELFAGTSRIARLGKAVGLKTVALDKSFDDADNKTKTNSMDINTDAGFL